MTQDEAYQVRVMQMGLHKTGPQDGTLDLINPQICTHNYSLALARAQNLQLCTVGSRQVPEQVQPESTELGDLVEFDSGVPKNQKNARTD